MHTPIQFFSTHAYVVTRTQSRAVSYLSLMLLVLPAVMEDSVTLSTQVATVVAQDEGLCLPVVMVITQRLSQHKAWQVKESYQGLSHYSIQNTYINSVLYTIQMLIKGC